MTFNDGLARFNAHFDSDCENCDSVIDEGDEMAYDKLDGEYICSDCTDERAADRDDS